MNGLPEYSPFLTFLILYVAVAGRYVLVSGLFYYYCERTFADGRRQIAPMALPHPKAEIYHSLVASVFFSLAGTVLIFAYRSGWTQIYEDPFEYGWFYLPLSFVILAFLHETYFYWTHRWMHRPKIFSLIHRVHHDSRPPSAWAAFSFHPLEAAIEALILPLLVMLVPVHFSVLALFLLFMTILGVINHLGYELYPAGFARGSFTRWWISATHHQMHHEKYNGNFGLYFTFWDRWMGTHHEGYQERFESVVSAPERSVEHPYDLIIAGGGLSGGLLAYHLRHKHPDWKILLIEKNSTLGGNHTWSFHGSDLSKSSLEWIFPLITRSWAGYEVRFPGSARFLETSYHSITSTRFHDQLCAALDGNILFEADVSRLESNSVELADGRILKATVTLDARGIVPHAMPTGYQKFLGLDVRLSAPHGLKYPILMDATVSQTDGFRFFYVLPWSERDLLIEDTRYSSSNLLNESQLAEEVLRYSADQNWHISEILRQEVGILPIPLHSSKVPPSTIGMRGGLFHDTTGYSLPNAVRLAEKFAELSSIDGRQVQNLLRNLASERGRNQWFQLALNRMLFLAAQPSERFRVLEKFYQLPVESIQRFYRGELKLVDRLRILSGRPPVHPYRAFVALFTSTDSRST